MEKTVVLCIISAIELLRLYTFLVSKQAYHETRPLARPIFGQWDKFVTCIVGDK